MVQSVVGGETWQASAITSLNGLIVTDIFAFDDQVAWVSTNDLGALENKDAIFQTTDGGQTWEEKFRGSQAANWGFYDIHFFNPLAGIFGIFPSPGSNASEWNDRVIAITDNGGDSWVLLPPNPYQHLLPLERIGILKQNESWEIKGDNIWVGTTMGRVLKSVDKGRNWQVYDTPFADYEPQREVLSVAFQDEMNGITLGFDLQFQLIFCRTLDRGQSWEMLPQPSENYYPNYVAFIPGSEQKLVAISNVDIIWPFPCSLYSNDFGESWQLIDMGKTRGSTRFLSPDIGWSSNGHVKSEREPAMYKWKNGNPTPVRDEFQSEGLSIYPNPFTDRIFLRCKDPENRPEYALIYNADGRMIRSEKITTNTTEIYLQGLPAGTYCMQLLGRDMEWAKQLVKVE